MNDDTPSLPYYRRWEIIVPVAIIAVILIGYTIAWYAAAGKIKSAIAERRETGLRGIALDYRALKVSGFPFALAIGIDSPSLKGAEWSWKSERIVARATIFNLGKATVSAAGAHDVTALGRRIGVNAETAKTVLRVRGKKGWTADTVLRRVSTSLDGRRLAEIGDIGLVVSQSEESPDDLQVIGKMEMGTLARIPALFSALGNDISFARADATIENIATQKRRGAAPLRLIIASSEILWGPLNTLMKGELGLDLNNRPDGELNIRLKDIDVLRDKLLDSQGVVQATKINLALQTIDYIMRDGEYAPLSLRDGKVNLGALHLMDLRPLGGAGGAGEGRGG